MSYGGSGVQHKHFSSQFYVKCDTKQRQLTPLTPFAETIDDDDHDENENNNKYENRTKMESNAIAAATMTADDDEDTMAGVYVAWSEYINRSHQYHSMIVERHRQSNGRERTQ